MGTSEASGYRRIATEETWSTSELMSRYRLLLDAGTHGDPGFQSVWGFIARNQSAHARSLRDRLQDVGARRIADMDAAGIDHALLMLTAPGVQMFEPPEACALAVNSNDQLAAAIARHPSRLSGLAAFAPNAPSAAATEIERCVNRLGLKGALVNSHAQGHYLDDAFYWPIFEACEALDIPLYLLPNTPPPKMIGPFLPRGLGAEILGHQTETSLHALRLIVGGVFDQFPQLKVVLGRLGEGLPFWHHRIDTVHADLLRTGRSDEVQPLKRRPSDYLRENFFYTSSGMGWEPAITFVQQQMGYDRVMYATGYPGPQRPDDGQGMDDLPMSSSQQHQFFQGNAERLFKL